MKLIYKPWGSNPTENIRGYPSDYPRDSKRIDDKDQVPSGWIEITEEAYRLIVQSTYADVAAINYQFDDSLRNSDSSKIDALKNLFDKCDATAAIWGSATRAQKDDFIEDFYKIIRRQKRQILDQYRPE